MKKIANFIKIIIILSILILSTNTVKAVVLMEYDATTYICDNYEYNSDTRVLTLFNCTGFLPDVTVYGATPVDDPMLPDITFTTSPTYDPGTSDYPDEGGSSGTTTQDQDGSTNSTLGPGIINTYLQNDQEVLEKIVDWLDYICRNSFISHSITTFVNIDVIPTVGTAGRYVNGAGIIDGVQVIWQIQVPPNEVDSEYLEFYSWDEPPSYYRAGLYQFAQQSEGRIILLFKSPEDRSRIIGNIPCPF